MARQMKDSGIEWIGEIPEGWRTCKIKDIFQVVSGATPKSEQPEYWDGDIVWVTPADYKTNDKFVSFGKRTITQVGYDSCGTTLIPAGSIIFSKRAPIGSVAIAQVPLCTNQGCLSCINKGEADTTFFYYVMSIFTEIFELYGSGTTFKELSYDNFAAFTMTNPSLAEQHRIAAFLDRKCAEIDAVIERTKATIEEYKMLKQAVITEAVTKGVRGTRKMKDSGIEWIGEIPEGWEVRKLGRFISIRSGITLGKTYPQDAELIELPYLRVANVKADGFALDDVATIEVTPEEAEKYAIKAGELLMTEGGDRDKLGRGTIWHGEISPCLHQNHVFAATCDETWLLTQYLACLTASNVGRQYFDITAKKTTNLACTNSNTILQFKIPLPSTEEQQEIIEWLPIRCAALDTLIAKKTALLTELETYKKSLIYEYVTGKKEASN